MMQQISSVFVRKFFNYLNFGALPAEKKIYSKNAKYSTSTVSEMKNGNSIKREKKQSM